MRVTVRLFARLKDITGAAELTRELPEGATARVLWEMLTDEFAELSIYRNIVSTAINTEYSKMSQGLADGDEVAFLPPVSGGNRVVL